MRRTTSPMRLQGTKPRSTVNHFGGSVGGPIAHDSFFFFFRQRVGADRTAYCHNPRLFPVPHSKQYVLQQLASASVPFYQQMFSLYEKHQRHTDRGTWMPRLAPPRMAARTGRASHIPAMTTNRCRRSAWTTTSTRAIRPGFGFSRTRVCKAAWTDPIKPSV